MSNLQLQSNFKNKLCRDKEKRTEDRDGKRVMGSVPIALGYSYTHKIWLMAIDTGPAIGGHVYPKTVAYICRVQQN